MFRLSHPLINPTSHMFQSRNIISGTCTGLATDLSSPSHCCSGTNIVKLRDGEIQLIRSHKNSKLNLNWDHLWDYHMKIKRVLKNEKVFAVISSDCRRKRQLFPKKTFNSVWSEGFLFELQFGEGAKNLWNSLVVLLA